MKDNKQIYGDLRKEYTVEEIANFAMIPSEVGEEASKQAREEFAALRMKRRAEMSEQDRLLSGLLSIKYQIKKYIDSRYFDASIKFGELLVKYLELVGRKQKEFADDIDIHPSRLSRILKGKEKIGKKLAFRLEKHSGEIIPAIYWWKLMQKEIEQEILTEASLKVEEKKHVKYVAYRA